MNAQPSSNTNVDPAELAKFGALAARWWDKNSEFKPLHDINPLRLNHIDKLVGLNGKRVIDIGCGGGILAESMAVRGADVTGIDLSEKPLKVAQLHLLESGQKVDYRLVAAEQIADEQPSSFDCVCCMEMLVMYLSPHLRSAPLPSWPSRGDGYFFPRSIAIQNHFCLPLSALNMC